MRVPVRAGRGRRALQRLFAFVSKAFRAPGDGGLQRWIRPSCSGDGFLKHISGKLREVPADAEAFSSLRRALAAARASLPQDRPGAAAPRAFPGMPQAEGAAAASILISCRDWLGLSAPRQAEPGCPSAGLSRSPTWCRDHPSTPTAGPGLRGSGVSMIYAIFGLISILSHPARPSPAPGGAPRSGRGRTPLFGFKRSSGRGGLGRRIPAGSRLRSRLWIPAPPWWCRRGG